MRPKAAAASEEGGVILACAAPGSLMREATFSPLSPSCAARTRSALRAIRKRTERGPGSSKHLPQASQA